MQALRPIDISTYAKLTVPASLGKLPKLEWIAIRNLVVDTAYQRDITGQGRGNVRRIATSFCWSMFTPVVVAPIGGGKYAIVDGQHRTTAAALCGVEKVPCAIIDAAQAEQAAAFQAINGNLTRLTSMHLYHAAVAAGDERATRVDAVCRRAKVTILRYPKAHNIIGVGETMAPKVIGRAVERFGDDVTVLALSMIVSTGGGQSGPSERACDLRHGGSPRRSSRMVQVRAAARQGLRSDRPGVDARRSRGRSGAREGFLDRRAIRRPPGRGARWAFQAARAA